MNRTLPGALVVWTSEAYDEFDYRASLSHSVIHPSSEISCPQPLVPFISLAELSSCRAPCVVPAGALAQGGCVDLWLPMT